MDSGFGLHHCPMNKEKAQGNLKVTFLCFIMVPKRPAAGGESRKRDTFYMLADKVGADFSFFFRKRDTGLFPCFDALKKPCHVPA